MRLTPTFRNHQEAVSNIDLVLASTIGFSAHSIVASAPDKEPPTVMVVVRHFREGQDMFCRTAFIV